MSNLVFLGQILLAVFLGGLLGWQREHIGRAAGLRTYSIVSLGSALFTILSLHAFAGDPSRIASQVVVGIGFLGAGTILHKGESVEGLTTAAGLWTVAAIGMAVGAGWYSEAVLGALFALGILFIDDKKLIK